MKPLKVPTMQELRRKAKKARVEFEGGFARSCYDYLAVHPEPRVIISYVEYDRTDRAAYRQARWLTGHHITAFAEMKEAGI